MARSIRIYEIVYQTHSIEPAPTEEFHYYPTEGMIYIYDLVQAPSTVEIINVRHVTSMCCLPPREKVPCICEDVPNPECKAH